MGAAAARLAWLRALSYECSQRACVLIHMHRWQGAGCYQYGRFFQPKLSSASEQWPVSAPLLSNCSVADKGARAEELDIVRRERRRCLHDASLTHGLHVQQRGRAIVMAATARLMIGEGVCVCVCVCVLQKGSVSTLFRILPGFWLVEGHGALFFEHTHGRAA